MVDVGRVAAALLDEATSGPEAQAFRRRVLEHTAKLIGFDTAIFMPSEPLLPGLYHKPLHHTRIYQQFRSLQPVYEAEQARARTAGKRHGAYVDTQIYSAGERGRLRFFNEILRPQGITSRIVAHLQFRGRTTATIHLCRHGGEHFDDEHCRLVRQLVPVITIADVALSRTPHGTISEDAEGELTDRELQVARHVQAGLTNREIALLLGTSPLTVRNQISRIYDRLGLGSRVELSAWLGRKKPT